MGSNGFEPLKAKPADLQSALVDRWSNFPSSISLFQTNVPFFYIRAGGGIRTPDPLITNQLLWPTELRRQKYMLVLIEEPRLFFNGAKLDTIFQSAKFFRSFFCVFFYFFFIGK